MRLRSSAVSLAVLAASFAAGLSAAPRIEQVPSDKPSAAQTAQIARKYGMFCCFGMNTYMDAEWTDGTTSPATYAPPPDLEASVDEWVKTARDAGMRYFLLVTKHHDGFCLWDSKFTSYDVGNPKVKNHLDVVGAVAKSCKKYGLSLAIYYSLWDRHEPSYAKPETYRRYLLGQLTELMTNYGPVCELWLDGGWVRPSKDWYLDDVYSQVKKLQPDCQISTNWTIGVPEDSERHNVTPDKQKTGYPIRYFPSDFRISDPYLPVADDPKLFTHGKKTYYMPYEATVTVSGMNCWYYNTKDTTAKSVDDLAKVFLAATANDNCLVLNVPPDRAGHLVPSQRQAVLDLAKRLEIGPGKPFPAAVKSPATSVEKTVAE